jgi:hypothetical protein
LLAAQAEPRGVEMVASGLLLSGMGAGLPLDAQISPDGLGNAGQQQPLAAESPRAEAEAGLASGAEDVAGDGAADEAASSVAPVWLQRLSLFVLVLFCVYLGVLVMILPWWTRVWDDNMFIRSRPALAAVLHTGATRGLISGLGLIDIWIGISEAVHYRDHRD